jgi:hypothetical protein
VSAIISECGTYRYRLERSISSPWHTDTFAFFGINPSTADANIDDATVRKWKGFAGIHGGARFIVGNVFAYRSTAVENLALAADPVGPANRSHLLDIADAADILVPCWGSRAKVPKSLWPHIDHTMELLISTGKPVMIFGLTNSGDPKHPLMLGYDTNLVRHRN